MSPSRLDSKDISASCRLAHTKRLNVRLDRLSVFKCFYHIILVYYILLLSFSPVQAGFWSFYFPNFFKPAGYEELTDMLRTIDNQINEVKDAFADSRYFWGLMQQLDKVDYSTIYPEESTCSEVFPLFRDLTIEYVFIDYDYYTKPLFLYRDHLESVRTDWYPAGKESKAALPRIWEHNLAEYELNLRVEWMSKLTNDEDLINKRNKLLEIWKSVRRGLDTSLPCIYMRYAYHQIAEDLNQVALEANLDALKAAQQFVRETQKNRVEKFKKSDQKIIKEIGEEKWREKNSQIRT